MTADDAVRWLNLALSIATIVAGTAQIRRWRGFSTMERLHWQSTAVLNLAALIGTVEGLLGHYPGGWRVYVLTVGLVWLLAAVLYQPVCAWRHKRDQARPTS